MTVSVKSLADGQLAATTGDLYTAPTSTQTVVESIKLTNRDTSTRTLNIFFLASGGTARELSSVDLSLAAGYTVEVLDKPITLSAGDKIQGDASVASKVDYVVSGVDTSGGVASSSFTGHGDTPDAYTGEGGNLVAVNSGATALEFKTVGIADDNSLEVDQADAADDDYAKFTANGLEGRSYAEVKTDLTLNLVENTAHSTDAHTMTIDGIDVSVHDPATTGVHGAGANTLLNTGDVDDTPVDAATTAPVSSNWAFDHVAAADPHTGYRLESADHTHASTGAQGGQLTSPLVNEAVALTATATNLNLTDDTDFRYLLMKRGNVLDVPVNAGWANTATGTGSLNQTPLKLQAILGATTLSSIAAHSLPPPMGVGNYIDWNEDFYVCIKGFTVFHTDPTNQVSRFQFRQTSTFTTSDLAERGVGIEVSGVNFDLFAESHDGTTRSELDLSTTLVNNTPYKLELVFLAGVGLRVYLDDVLLDTKTTNLPTGTGGNSKFGCSTIRTAGASTTTWDSIVAYAIFTHSTYGE